MFDTKKFGGYLSRLLKNADMTQTELADRLNLTRQAISRYEHGDSFPDVSILVLIADICAPFQPPKTSSARSPQSSASSCSRYNIRPQRL